MDAKRLQRRTAAGLTLIELSVALAVAVVVSMGVKWSVDTVNRRALENESLKLQTSFRYAQRMAMMHGCDWGIMFLDNSYAIYGATENSETELVEIGGGVILLAVSKPIVLYSPRGTVKESYTITLEKGRFRQKLTILPSSGRIKIYEVYIK